MSNESIYRKNLDKNTANHAQLSPLSFIERAASVYPQRISVCYGDRQYTWSETYQRSRQMASALQKAGIGHLDTVAVMLPNLPEMVELHFAIPMSGGVINALNIRLDADAIKYMLEHGEAKILFVDREFSATVQHALAEVENPPLVVNVDDQVYCLSP